MTKPITAGQVKTIVKNEYEAERVNHEAAELIAAHCEAHAGKPITEKNKPEGWFISKRSGWTSLQSYRAFYDRMGVKEGGPNVDLILDYHEVHAVYPAARELRAESARYFDALLARQSSRLELLADPVRLRAIAKALNDVHKALAAVAEVLPNGPPHAGGVTDRYQIIEAADLNSVKVGRLML